MKPLLTLILLLAIAAPAIADTATYKIDPEHTNVEFEIDHLFSRIRGRFAGFEGALRFDPKSHSAKDAKLTVQVESLNTLVEKRDAHLLSPDFFAAEEHPTIQFRSTTIRHVAGQNYRMDGEITIREQTRPISLDVEYLGTAADPWGAIRAGFTVRGQLNRQDFGVSWNQAVENGVLLVGNEVDLVINVEAIKQSKK